MDEPPRLLVSISNSRHDWGELQRSLNGRPSHDNTIFLEFDSGTIPEELTVDLNRLLCMIHMMNEGDVDAETARNSHTALLRNALDRCSDQDRMTVIGTHDTSLSPPATYVDTKQFPESFRFASYSTAGALGYVQTLFQEFGKSTPDKKQLQVWYDAFFRALWNHADEDLTQIKILQHRIGNRMADTVLRLEDCCNKSFPKDFWQRKHRDGIRISSLFDELKRLVYGGSYRADEDRNSNEIEADKAGSDQITIVDIIDSVDGARVQSVWNRLRELLPQESSLIDGNDPRFYEEFSKASEFLTNLLSDEKPYEASLGYEAFCRWKDDFLNTIDDLVAEISPRFR